MRTLFVSYTGIALAINQGTLAPLDVTDPNALFYLGCAREPLMNDLDVLTRTVYPNDPARAREVRALVVGAVLKAEQEGRVAWRKERTMGHYEDVHKLLIANGLPGIDQSRLSITLGTYHPALMSRIVEELGIPVRVVY